MSCQLRRSLTRRSAGTDRAAGPASASLRGGGAHVEEQRRGPEELSTRRRWR